MDQEVDCTEPFSQSVDRDAILGVASTWALTTTQGQAPGVLTGGVLTQTYIAESDFGLCICSGAVKYAQAA